MLTIEQAIEKLDYLIKLKNDPYWERFLGKQPSSIIELLEDLKEKILSQEISFSWLEQENQELIKRVAKLEEQFENREQIGKKSSRAMIGLIV